MTAKAVRWLNLMAILSLSAATTLFAQPPDLFLEHLAAFEWTGAIDDTWRTAGNWNPSVMPPPPGGITFPNDAGRMDADPQVIVPLVGANLSVALSSDLTVDIVGGDVTVAAVKLGGSAGAVSTNVISSTGHLLIFENFEQNDLLTNPGDPEADPPLLPEPIWSFNQGTALIWSTGTQGVGKENRISADIEFHEAVHVEGDRDMHIFGDLIEHVGTVDGAFAGSITNLLSGGARLYIHGNIVTNDVYQIGNADPDFPDTQDQPFTLNNAGGGVLPANPQFPGPPSPARTGVMDVSGSFVGPGDVQVGGPSIVILRGDSIGPDPMNPTYSARVFPSGRIVLAHDGALGGGDMRGGATFISDDDNRVIPVDISMPNNITFRGASEFEEIADIGDHSIEFSGDLVQTNTRSIVNFIPYDFESDTGKTLTLSGDYFPLQGGDNNDSDRIWTIEGSGKTYVTGGIHNEFTDADFPGRNGHFRKRGTGTVVIAYDASNTDASPTDYRGNTYVENGNLHFATSGDLPDPGTTFGSETGDILARYGAVGIDTGVVGNTDFLNLIHNSTVTNFPTATTPPFFRTFAFGNNQITTRWDHGGLMLGADEYDDDLDFSGDLASGLGRAANMTLAAWETGSTYTGTITPSSTVARYPDTYQLGGGLGTLTMPNANQLTGSRNLLVDNGGEVSLQSTNNYTGSTEVRGNTTLTVTSLADGASSIGTSTTADDLVLQNGTLNYVGAAVSTNRLFTVGTAGGTIESSGSGPINFTNSAPLAIDVAEDREGVASSAVRGIAAIFGIPTFNGHDGPVMFDTRDLVTGMAVSVATSEETTADPFNLNGDPLTQGIGDDLIITSVPDPDVIGVGEEDITEGPDPGIADDEIPWAGFMTTYPHIRYNFGPAPARTLRLAGDNTGNNTLSPQINDAADRDEAGGGGGPGDKGSVGVTKSGDGKWILANANNTYTGDTVVEQGTLAAVSVGTGDVHVEDGGTLAPGMSVGTLQVGGIYNQTAGGTLEIEIEGDGAGQYDVLDVLGDPDVGDPEPGDYNNDFVVNAADYAVWRNLLGQSVALPNEGEDVTPGQVTEEDYVFWRENFGDSSIQQGASAVIEGSILIDLVGFTPTVGDMFTVLTANSIAAGNLTLTGESAGFELLVNPTTVVLSFTGAGAASAVPEPSSLCLLLSVCWIISRRVRR
jgi:autotransporter-associated beta strand protein